MVITILMMKMNNGYFLDKMTMLTLLLVCGANLWI